jgi:hypothetical protein
LINIDNKLTPGISRRGDLEVLLFNVIDWLGGKLAWDKEPQMKPRQIHQMKINAFANVKKFLAKTFSTQSYPGFVMILARFYGDCVRWTK